MRQTQIVQMHAGDKFDLGATHIVVLDHFEATRNGVICNILHAGVVQTGAAFTFRNAPHPGDCGTITDQVELAVGHVADYGTTKITCLANATDGRPGLCARVEFDDTPTVEASNSK